jgi:hypothetical protein
MNVRSGRGIAVVLLLMAGAPLSADRVRLRSGQVVDGTFIGGDSATLRLLLDNGTVSVIPVEQTERVELSPRTPAPKPAPKPAAPPAPAAASRPKGVTVPAGTAINVRLTDAIDVDASQAGQKFKAIVDDPVRVDGSIVIPRGASATLQAVQVQQSGKMKGSDKISLKISTITFGGMVYEIATSYVESKGKGEGKRTARKVGGGAGLGAVLGGVIGGGEGAAIGGVIGGVTGAAVASGGEEHLSLPAETRLQFHLSSAVTVQP